MKEEDGEERQDRVLASRRVRYCGTDLGPARLLGVSSWLRQTEEQKKVRTHACEVPSSTAPHSPFSPTGDSHSPCAALRFRGYHWTAGSVSAGLLAAGSGGSPEGKKEGRGQWSPQEETGQRDMEEETRQGQKREIWR